MVTTISYGPFSIGRSGKAAYSEQRRSFLHHEVNRRNLRNKVKLTMSEIHEEIAALVEQLDFLENYDELLDKGKVL